MAWTKEFVPQAAQVINKSINQNMGYSPVQHLQLLRQASVEVSQVPSHWVVIDISGTYSQRNIIYKVVEWKYEFTNSGV
jgi:hypothetical protein